MDTQTKTKQPQSFLNPATLKAPTQTINAARFLVWHGSQKRQSIRTGRQCTDQDLKFGCALLFWLRLHRNTRLWLQGRASTPV